MNSADLRAMRNEVIEAIFQRMADDPRIFFLSADFGAPSLDRLRAAYPGRFISVGIAEQNLMGVAAGLALEGCVVYAYGIAPFISMRCYEQIRVQLALLAQTRPMNVNLISVGAGISYDVSGPTHHCIEDIGLMRMLPNMALCSPSDWVQARQFVSHSLATPGPKYLRLDGKIVPPLYPEDQAVDFQQGFAEVLPGERLVLVGTGIGTQTAMEWARAWRAQGLAVGVLDLFMLKPFDEARLAQTLRKYECIVTIEEAFAAKGGLDSLILHLANRHDLPAHVRCIGFADTYRFDNGGREHLRALYGFSRQAVEECLHRCWPER